MKSCNIFVHNEAEFLMRSELLSLLIINIDITYAVTDDCSQLVIIMLTYVNVGGTAVAVPPPFRPGNPALCGSRPLVTPYYCRLGDLLCYFV